MIDKVKREAPMAALILVIGNEKTGQNDHGAARRWSPKTGQKQAKNRPRTEQKQNRETEMQGVAACAQVQACDAGFRRRLGASLHQLGASAVVVSAARTDNVH